MGKTKELLIEIMQGDEELGLYEKPKQEALEEAAKRYTEIWFKNYDYAEELFIQGAEWQYERMYSKEEVDVLLKLLKQTTEYEVLQSFRDKVHQFKKK